MTTKQATNGASSALAMRQEAAVAPFQPQNLDEAMRLAETLAASNLIPDGLKGKPRDVFVTLMAGHDLGVSPMQAMMGLSVVKGKIRAYADFAVGLCVRRPAVCEYFICEESTDTQSTWVAKRRGAPKEVRYTYTMAMAVKAGLPKQNQNYNSNPAAMLRARCSYALARMVFPDLVQGMYDPSEVFLEDEPNPATVAAFVPPPEPKREPRPVAATVTATAAPEPEATTTATAEPEDAEIVGEPLPGDEPEQTTTTTATDDQPLTDDEKIAGWVQMIGRAATLEELRAVGQELAAQEPKGSPVRAACQPAYGKRSAELRRAAQ